MQRHNVLSVEHCEKLYTAKEALAFFERDPEDDTSSLSLSSSSSETDSDEDIIPPSLKINKVRHTFISNEIKNTSKIPESHNSKDSSVSKKWGEFLQPEYLEYPKKSTPKVVSDKFVTSKTSVSNTCKGGESLQPSGQKSSKKDHTKSSQ